MARSNLVLVLAVALLALTAGCAGGLSGDGGGADAGTDGSRDGGDAGGQADAGDDAGDGAADRDGDGSGDESGGEAQSSQAAYEAQDRAIIRTGHARLRVDEFDAARDRIVNVAESRGGFVAGSEQRVERDDEQTWTEGRVTIRVPSEAFGEAFRAVKDEGEVVRSSSSSKDVSDQLVDLEARITNLENRRDRLRQLYEAANSTDETLRVGRELSQVQEEIERLRARQRSLQDRVAYGTITVELTEPRPTPTPTATPTPTPTPEPAYHETSPVAAFIDSVNGVVVMLRTFVVTVSYLLPYLVTLGLPVGVAAALVYRRRDWLDEE
jgi:hypothetical protein